MISPILLSAVLAFVIAAASAWMLVRFAQRLGLVDIPNERSSHDRVVPRGAGIGIVLGILASGLMLAAFGILDANQTTSLLVACVGVGGIGLADDIKSFGIGSRILIQIVAAAIALRLCVGFELSLVSVSLMLVLTLVIVGLTNAFNFMDGIDGIALQQTIFLAAALVLLTGLAAFSWFAVLISLIAASVAILFWNWPPARAFLGDSGSGFLGFLLAFVSVLAFTSQAAKLEALIIIWGVFLTDSVLTLLRRMLTGQRWYAPHRSHAYQILSRHWGSHLHVTLLAAAINFLWLLPIAVLVEFEIVGPLLGVLLALAPLALGVIYLRAGALE